VSVAFTPQAVGPVTGVLTVTDDSGNLGSTQAVPLDGRDHARRRGDSNGAILRRSSRHDQHAKNITLQSTGTGPLQVTSIVTAAPFSQTIIAAGASRPRRRASSRSHRADRGGYRFRKRHDHGQRRDPNRRPYRRRSAESD